MGNNDGTVNGKPFFQAHKNHGLFESADKVRKYTKKEDVAEQYAKEPIITVHASYPQTGNQAQSDSSYASMTKKDKRSKSVKKNDPNKKRSKDVHSVGDEYEGYKVNTRVVYFDKNPILGTLKFLGYLKKYNDKIYAVVETVSFKSLEFSY